MNIRKEKISGALANAEPALLKAKEAVGSINKKDLDQVRSYPNPPSQVILALEPVMLMLGTKEKDLVWKTMKKALAKSNFITSIIDYNVDKLTPRMAKKIKKRYLSDINFNYDIVKQASKACAPLVMWVDSMISYAGVKNSVVPLMNEMKKLESAQKLLANKMDELKKIQEQLVAKIEQLKQQYSELIKAANRTKNEKEACATKVERAINLLNNLSSEDKRWGKDIQSFDKEISTLMGDCLVIAGFLAYIGYFNQAYREMLVRKWQERLSALKIKTKDGLSVINYVSSPAEQLEWSEHGLPPDNLCVENAIMLRKFNRYPLIIDPSGQATAFLMLQYKDRKIERTSFLDDNFLKKA